MKISSPAWQNGEAIPNKYTCDGNNINPPLTITEVPKEAKSLALIVDDPDAPAGTWIHWLVWNIEPKTTAIAENSIPGGAIQGTNSFGEVKYGGPCPPPGEHRYFFKVFALDTILNLSSQAKINELETALQGHILGQSQIMGRYQRQ